MKIAAGIQSSGEAANRGKFSISSMSLDPGWGTHCKDKSDVTAQLKSVYQQAQ